MGLQIVGYGEVSKEKIEGQMFSDAVDIDTRTFPDRCKEFENDSIVYIYGETIADFSMRYSSYNRLREQLAELAGYHYYDHSDLCGTSGHVVGAWKASEGPFWELLSFSDCEGCIGTSVCKKLAKDFADFQEKADQRKKVALDDYFLESYRVLRHTFEVAAVDGLVKFW